MNLHTLRNFKRKATASTDIPVHVLLTLGMSSRVVEPRLCCQTSKLLQLCVVWRQLAGGGRAGGLHQATSPQLLKLGGLGRDNCYLDLKIPLLEAN